jgi:hypothetical protein
VNYAKFEPAGATNATVSASTFTNARTAHGTIVANGYIYLIGGCTVAFNNCDTNGEVLSDVRYAPLNTGGNVGSWTVGPALPQARGEAAVTIYNNYIYVLGGLGPCGAGGIFSFCSQTYYNSIDPSTGALGGSWTSGTTLNTAGRDRATAITNNGYIYLGGGRSNGGAITASVEWTSLDASTGATGTWAQTTGFPEAREHPTLAAYAGKVYVAGGWTGATSPTTVYYTTLNAGTGGITAWNSAGNLQAGRDGLEVQFYNGYMYAISGVSSTVIEYAPVNSDGTVGTFVSSPNPLAAYRRIPGQGGVFNGYIYIAGGELSGGGTSNTVEAIPVNNGGPGNLGTLSRDTTHVPATSVNGILGAVAYANYIYLLGGCTNVSCTTTTLSSQRATIASDGTVSSWSVDTSLPAGCGKNTASIVSNRIYMLCDGSTNVYYISINTSTGAFSGSWTAVDSIHTSRIEASMTAYNNVLYVMGGNGLNNTEYAQVNSNGTLSTLNGCTPPGGTASWCAGPSFNTAKWQISTTAYAGYLYIMGGWDGSSELQEVLAAQINSDGTLGAWVATTSMPYGLRQGGAIAANGYMYRLGGFSPPFDSTGQKVIYAPILAGGRIGDWQQSPGIATTDSHVAAGVFYINGMVYLVDGHGVSTTNSVEYAALKSIPRVGYYSRFFDFDKGIKPSKLVTRGTKRSGATVNVNYLSSSNTGTTLDSLQNGGDTGYTGANLLTLNIGSSRTLAQYFWLRYTIDESRSAVFPDDSNQTTVTNYDLYFTPGGTGRLKGGRMFTGGQDRGLDAGP